MPDASGFWYWAGAVCHLLAALSVMFCGVWVAIKRERFGRAGNAIAAALFVTALWSLATVASGSSSPVASVLETLQNLVWLLAAYRLFAIDGRHTTGAAVRAVLIVLAGIEIVSLMLDLRAWDLGLAGGSVQMAFLVAVALRLLVAVGALVLVHNLYTGGSPQSRIALRWPAAALAIRWIFDLNFYTIAFLGGEWPMELAAARGLSVIGLAVLMGLGLVQGDGPLRLRPSRAVTFQTASLVLIGSYFLAMFAIANWLSFAGGDFARLMGFVFLSVSSVLALFILPSARMRGWVRVMVTKHLFQHRYDYRSEWLRFTRTIGHGGDEARPLEQRVVQAVADIAESPAGLLLTPDDTGDLVLAARWQWPAADVPAIALSTDAASFFEHQGFVVDLDDLRRGIDERGERGIVPAWLREETRAWALVPLMHYDRLIGVVVLAQPQQPRKFDWEDFDLLRVVGRQLASYLAEHASQQALAEAGRFDDFNRRIAFVMHDIKNLASQLSLLARNAERHADKPAFRADMLLTLRNSADKLNALLARLSRYGGAVDKLGEVDAVAALTAVADRFRLQHPVLLAEIHPCMVNADRESLDQVLVHLVQNAIDASGAASPVLLALVTDSLHARFEIVDSGCGMSPEFVRSRLFKPFVSSKVGGFGIGAFEARELVRAMHGRLEVESREGLGSRFIVRLPLSASSGLRVPTSQLLLERGQKVA